MATPRSRSDSSTGQASVIDFIATAPFEICALVFAPLDNCHLKALRLTCKRLAHLISPHLRFKRVFISASPLDVQVFRAIAEHDIFRRNVREIVWDDARYEKPPPDFVTFGGEYNDECVWPASKDEEGAGYEMWEREKEKDKWRGFRHVIRIVAQQRSATSKITELVFDGNQIHSGLTCGILHTPEPCVEYNHLAAVIKKPGFTTLRLNLMICGADNNNYLAFRNGRLKQMLEADLQHFILETDEDGSLGQEPQPLTATRDHFIPLRSIFPVEVWKNLVHFGLSRFLVKQQDLLDFLAVLPQTLHSVELSFLMFMANNGDYRELLFHIRDDLGWQGRAIRPRLLIRD
ncbi:hypothetical protein K4K49_013089 [Colletotrichum sp. SAR 10_70]|nr:hypothetical protein K4K50_000821 [Colletotrichum sp. SAR 10_71]KAI8187296.1 hypothetical protein K4K49_013089 [Colletotrichum sp. SAR 10_70]KAI8188463.1 hypothetical protein KHU50_000938 [Colletotrichum sp. SAR 10_65]